MQQQPPATQEIIAPITVQDDKVPPKIVMNDDVRLKNIEERLDDLTMAVELFKTYGFQPKQYDQYLQALKDQKQSKGH